MNFRALECRTEPVKLNHYDIKMQGNNTVKSKKEILYKYYICDYCKEKIIICKRHIDQDGGVKNIRIYGKINLNLALHNRCLKPTLKLINEKYDTNF